MQEQNVIGNNEKFKVMQFSPAIKLIIGKLCLFNIRY